MPPPRSWRRRRGRARPARSLPAHATGLRAPGTLQRVDDRPERDRVVERVEPELERGDDAEVGARAAESPEQVRMFLLGGAHDPLVRRDELDREQVVDRQAVLALESAHAAAERQPRNPGVRHDPDGADEAVLLRRVVEVAEERAAADAGNPTLRVNLNAPHAGEVDHDPVVAGREPRNAVAAAANRNHELLLARESKCRDDVVDARRPNDERGPPVGHPVPDRACSVVPGVVREDDLAAERLAEGAQASHAGEPSRWAAPLRTPRRSRALATRLDGRRRRPRGSRCAS